ncbi:MAG TPA: pilus assembly protein N-terminal domain-containing protein [Candidatus Binataceae bacterium]|nr:pilus assembly protein N-terminal domain-containing protein [Candidatus Binataceae bacterium]
MEIDRNRLRLRARRLSLRSALSLFLLVLLLPIGATAHATDGDSPARKVIFVTLNAGESYVIDNVGEGTTPAVHVLTNPHALIVSSDKPGEVVLVGAEAGQWAIDVTTDDGQDLRYKVSVNAIANPFRSPLEPGKNPPALGSPHFDSAASRPVTVAALDPSAGLPLPAGRGSSLSASAAAPASSSPSVPIAAAAAASPPPLSPFSGTLTAASKPSGVAPAMTLAAGSTTLPPAAPAAAVMPAPASDTSASSPMLHLENQTGEIQQFRTNPPAVPRTPSTSGTPDYLPPGVIELPASSSRIIDFTNRIRRISIANSTIADIDVISPYEINVIGHKEGFTTLTVWDSSSPYPQQRQVRVDPYGKQQVMLNVIVAELDRSRLEQQGINWALTLPNQGVSLVGLPGQVATPYSPTVTLTPTTVLGAGSATQTTVSQSVTGSLPAAGTLIPLLLSSTINYGIAAGNSNFQTQFLFQELEDHNFAKILAEPRLLANSGEKAEFLSGGEIPIVIAQALNTSIVFKKFGTSVIFVPTVIGSDQIALKVKPEVSQPDYAHAVQLFGFSVPAFVTRSAETSVRLRNNQTLIIAGLILHTKTSTLQKTPYLGDIPYLGALFRATSYQDQENDLVMTVTPEIVAPIPAYGVAAYPTDRGPLSPSETATQPLYPQDASRPRF